MQQLCIMNYALTKNEKCTLPYTLCWANCGRWLKSLALECSTMTKVPGSCFRQWDTQVI